MGTREKAAQLLMVGFEGTSISPELTALIGEGPVGGVILFSRNVVDAAQVSLLTDALQQIAAATSTKIPLLIAADQEGGEVRRIRNGVTQAPGARLVAESMSPEEAADLASEVAEGLLALGINANLAPVADVVGDRDSFLYGRSYGSDPGTVASYVGAVIRGHERAGVVSAAKHFPGHGSAAGDTHAGGVVSSAGPDEMEATHLVPFEAAIYLDVPMIMVSHVVAEGLGDDVPASVSPAMIQGLLRDRLGFGGVVITDDMEMGGSSGGPSALEAVRAGADLVLVGYHADVQRSALEALVAGVDEGLLSRERLDEAVTRVLRLKQRYGLL